MEYRAPRFAQRLSGRDPTRCRRAEKPNPAKIGWLSSMSLKPLAVAPADSYLLEMAEPATAALTYKAVLALLSGPNLHPAKHKRRPAQQTRMKVWKFAILFSRIRRVMVFGRT
jgi:hypothetical protein